MGLRLKRHFNDALNLCWKERNIKKSELWLCCVGFTLDIRLKLLGIEGLEVLIEGEGQHRPQPWGH